jgi:hypothetical protein
MKSLLQYLMVAFSMAACTPGTDIIGSWKSADEKASELKIDKLLVAALTGKTNARQTVENDLAGALMKNGFTAVKSIDIMPPTFTEAKVPDKEQLLSKIKGTGVDAILTVALIDEETESRYVPGNNAYAPMPRFGYYGTFWRYYNTWYPTLYSPGYYEEDKVYFIETNLYDAVTEELIWSAQSETYNSASLNGFSEDFASVVISKMKKDGVLKK